MYHSEKFLPKSRMSSAAQASVICAALQILMAHTSYGCLNKHSVTMVGLLEGPLSAGSERSSDAPLVDKFIGVGSSLVLLDAYCAKVTLGPQS